MHLAICDDHMADRKQMERLLGRESDRRLNTTGVSKRVKKCRFANIRQTYHS